MIWGIFIGCTSVTAASIPLLFLKCCPILQGIAMSIVAAYIFYIIMQFIPSLVEEHRKRSAMAITYRKLQLMLCRLDDLFVDPYNTVKGDSIGSKVALSIEEFYDKDFLISFLRGFDLNQNSNSQNGYTNKLESYRDYLQGMWKECQRYGNEALNTPYLQNDAELAYQVQYLISDNAINSYFKYLYALPQIDYQCVLALNQKDDEICTQSIINVIILHKQTFAMYEKLKRDKRFTNIFKPSFYVNQKGNKNEKQRN